VGAWGQTGSLPSFPGGGALWKRVGKSWGSPLPPPPPPPPSQGARHTSRGRHRSGRRGTAFDAAAELQDESTPASANAVQGTEDVQAAADLLSSDLRTPASKSKEGDSPKRETNSRVRLGRKVKNSQARTGHQRGMGGRGTDDDDTHEQHTDTNRLTRHTASWLPHTLSWRTHNSGPHPSCRPPQHSNVPKQGHNNTTDEQEVTCETRAGLLRL